MMLFTQAAFLGILPSSGRRPFTYAALDDQLRVVTLGRGALDEVLTLVGSLPRASAAVAAPRRPALRRTGPSAGSSFLPEMSPREGWPAGRVAERELRRLGIRISLTPSAEALCQPWVQHGFALYRRMEGLGYQAYPAEAERQFMEVNPHACFTIWLGHRPFPREGLQGRLQRQIVLYDRGLDLPDPLRFLEEITRHHILTGALPLSILQTPYELDALAAAYSAWRAVTRPREVFLLGDREEGQILLPVGELRERY